MAQLQQLQLKTTIVTEEDGEAAFCLQPLEAASSGADYYKRVSNATQKVEAINRLRAVGHVVGFVGDAIHDALALSAADVGVVMGVSGMTVASDTADVVLMDSDIRSLPVAIQLARKAQNTIIQNVVFSIVSKLLVIGLAIGGYAWVWLAIMGDCGTMLVVTANSLRILSYEKCQLQSAAAAQLQTDQFSPWIDDEDETHNAKHGLDKDGYIETCIFAKSRKRLSDLLWAPWIQDSSDGTITTLDSDGYII